MRVLLHCSAQLTSPPPGPRATLWELFFCLPGMPALGNCGALLLHSCLPHSLGLGAVAPRLLSVLKLVVYLEASEKLRSLFLPFPFTSPE